MQVDGLSRTTVTKWRARTTTSAAQHAVRRFAVMPKSAVAQVNVQAVRSMADVLAFGGDNGRALHLNYFSAAA